MLVNVSGAHFDPDGGVPQCRSGVALVPASHAAGAESSAVFCRTRRR